MKKILLISMILLPVSTMAVMVTSKTFTDRTCKIQYSGKPKFCNGVPISSAHILASLDCASDRKDSIVRTPLNITCGGVTATVKPNGEIFDSNGHVPYKSFKELPGSTQLQYVATNWMVFNIIDNKEIDVMDLVSTKQVQYLRKNKAKVMCYAFGYKTSNGEAKEVTNITAIEFSKSVSGKPLVRSLQRYRTIGDLYCFVPENKYLNDEGNLLKDIKEDVATGIMVVVGVESANDDMGLLYWAMPSFVVKDKRS